jgi:hypothetical protein
MVAGNETELKNIMNGFNSMAMKYDMKINI